MRSGGYSLIRGGGGRNRRKGGTNARGTGKMKQSSKPKEKHVRSTRRGHKGE